MAKREKDRLYYEITKEKPYGSFQMLMVGGAAGSVLGFLIISLVGAYEGLEMDSLVLAFLVASLLGFFFGLLMMWLVITYFEKLIPASALIAGMPISSPLGQVPAPELATNASEGESSPGSDSDENKGKSVDFVFPELSPDQQ